MSPVVCPGCGQEAEPGDLECSLCGRDLGAAVNRAPLQDPPPRPVPPARRDEGAGQDWARQEEPPRYRERPPEYEPRRPNAVIGIAVVIAVVVVAAGAVALLRRPAAPQPPAASAGTTVSASVSPPDVTSSEPSSTTSSSESSDPSTEGSSGSTAAGGFPPVTITGHECGRLGAGPYAAAAAGNDHTSCPFALAVRNAYVASGADGGATRLRVFSTVTGKAYTMTCADDQPVTCTGGNDAVVYLYGGVASFG